MSFPFESANEHDFFLRGVDFEEVDVAARVAACAKTLHNPAGLKLAARALWQRGLRSIRRLFRREPVWQPIDTLPAGWTAALIAVRDRSTGTVLLRPELYLFTGRGIGKGWIAARTAQPLALTAHEDAMWRPTTPLLPTLHQFPAVQP